MVCGKYMYPQDLIELRQQMEFGNISSQQLRESEKRCLKELVNHQVKNGLKIVSDGCIMRPQWDFDFYFGLDGIDKRHVKSGHIFVGYELAHPTPAVVARIRFNEAHPVFTEFGNLHKVLPDGIEASVLIPAPAQFLMWLLMQDISWKSVYYDVVSIMDDISEAWRKTILKLHNLGCRHIILEDRSWGTLCRKDDINRIIQSGIDPHQLCGILRRVNDKTLEDVSEDLEVMIYLKRLEIDTTQEIMSRHCELISEEAFGHKNIPTIVLDMPDSHGESIVELVKCLPSDKRLVLGVVDGRHPQLEGVDDIEKKVNRIRRVIGDRLRAVTVIGGFKRENSLLGTTAFTEEDQWNKIKLLKSLSELMA